MSNKRTIKTDLNTKFSNAENANATSSIRPQTLNEYIGQDIIKKSISIALKSARKRNTQMPHVLFYGPPGLGKTTLANIIANEMHSSLITTVGSNIEKPADVAALLNNVSDRSIVFIDEIHRINRIAEECLYSAMEDGFISISIGAAEQAKTIKLTLPQFTLIGATTRPGMLSAPLRDRFVYHFKMDYYTIPELTQISAHTLHNFEISADRAVCAKIASVSRGTPRLANKYCTLLRDYVIAEDQTTITGEVIGSMFKIAGIHDNGLSDNDLKVLKALYIAGKPIGLNSLSRILGEDVQTIEDMYEPFLIYNQYILRTATGRELTPKGTDYVKNFLKER